MCHKIRIAHPLYQYLRTNLTATSSCSHNFSLVVVNKRTLAKAVSRSYPFSDISKKLGDCKLQETTKGFVYLRRTNSWDHQICNSETQSKPILFEIICDHYSLIIFEICLLYIHNFHFLTTYVFFLKIRYFLITF